MEDGFGYTITEYDGSLLINGKENEKYLERKLKEFSEFVKTEHFLDCEHCPIKETELCSNNRICSAFMVH